MIDSQLAVTMVGAPFNRSLPRSSRMGVLKSIPSTCLYAAAPAATEFPNQIPNQTVTKMER